MNEIILVLLILAGLVAIFSLARNTWVFEVRMDMLKKDFSTYKKLHSYDYMFYKFWVWDVKKFIKEE